MGRVIRIVLLVLLLVVLALVIWLRMTPAGHDFAGSLPDRWHEWRYPGAEQDAAAKLTALGVTFGLSAPPQRHPVTIDCKDKSLGDEGYRLVGKCFRLETASFIHCDLNDDRMRNLKGLNHLTSLIISDAPEVSDAGIKNVAKLEELASLTLRGTGVGDEGLISIARLPELKALNLSQTRVTDAGMPTLANLHTVHWLLLCDTEVTDEGVAKLKGMAELKQISLSGSKVTDQGKAQLKSMYPGLTIK